MVAYRRNIVPGGTFFFTVTLRDRTSDLLTRHVDLLRAAYADMYRRHPVTTDAIVILPDHLHAIWTLPPDDGDYPGRWRYLKSRFVRALRRAGRPISPDARGEAAIWQRRYWEHTIQGEADSRRHVDYIHYNPVRHGLVARPSEWPHSSLHRYIARGVVAPDWAEAPDEGAMPCTGERN